LREIIGILELNTARDAGGRGFKPRGSRHVCDAVTSDPIDSGARDIVAIPLKEGMSAKEFRQAALALRDLVCEVERRFGVSVSEDIIARMLHARSAKASPTEEGF
jgi:hypothetical protein